MTFFAHVDSCCLIDDSTHTGALEELLPYLNKGLALLSRQLHSFSINLKVIQCPCDLINSVTVTQSIII